MLVSTAGPDGASRAALRLLIDRLPGVSAIEGAPAMSEVSPLTEAPTLQSAQLVESGPLRAVSVISRTPGPSGFGAFLDGAQRVQVIGRMNGLPLVLGTVAAAVRVRINRRLIAWGGESPKVEKRIYVPVRYLGQPINLKNTVFEIVDTSAPDSAGEFPSMHPSLLLERAVQRVHTHRDQLESRLAEAWCAASDAPIFIDGGISASRPVASCPLAVGVIKSHRTLYVEGAALGIVLDLRKGERSSVFRVSPRGRKTVMSWYLRVRDAAGRDALWGLVRIEIAETESSSDRADEISRWVMAEMSPLSLPDGRWDRMAYGVRDCEEFLRAIS